ncbi:tRNA-splicing endonuclease subunit sen54 N-term-domain-containing protein [Xylogone sp. PMI_703]|nr:tRNA-splicing endonuclease subunit sen54 N-term-domain-containing protein [Xylogone sp. PMI_703]
MADVDEDAPVTSLSNQVHEDHDPSDETQDFRFLASLTSKTGHQIPKRGEKDFERHGTKQQDNILEASRQAMHDALSHTRVHAPKSHIRGFYYGRENFDWDDVEREEWMRGLDKDYVVVLETSKGPHFRTMGKTPLRKQGSRLWLLPEEALYLVERGNLDLWWPPKYSSPFALEEFVGRPTGEEEVPGTETNEVERDEGVPMSLQATYALLIGDDNEDGKISLDRYNVYANLKRTGYVVSRAPDPERLSIGNNGALRDRDMKDATGLFGWLFGAIFAKPAAQQHAPYGPLVKPGMYRSYNAIYQQIAIIPRHQPVAVLASPASAPEAPFSVFFEIWKPSRIPTFAKSNPGQPDFRVAIVDAHAQSLPSLGQLSALLESTPWDPPHEDMSGPAKSYQRLKHGWRNVVLAVVDQGIISYLRLCEGAFGEEKVYERFDRANVPGNKQRGGGSGSSRGGKGRGRGRGGGRGGRK